MRRVVAILCTAAALALGTVATVEAAAAPQQEAPQACAFCWPTNR
ncbi:hypothetical protein [Cumulibacter manganitolerans]|nr:hypothetical protein [Cumulibacter manganitolerans]